MNKPEIQLHDHYGVSIDGKVVDHGQYIVFADGVQVGYMSKVPGAWFACIVTMSDEDKQLLVDAINEKLTVKMGGIAMPPPREDEDEEEED